MKKTIIIILIVSMFVFLTSCDNDSEIQEELLSYYNEEWIPISVWNKQATSKILDLIFERGEEDEEVIIIREEEIIPDAKEVVARLESLQFEHEHVKN